MIIEELDLDSQDFLLTNLNTQHYSLEPKVVAYIWFQLYPNTWKITEIGVGVLSMIRKGLRREHSHALHYCESFIPLFSYGNSSPLRNTPHALQFEIDPLSFPRTILKRRRTSIDLRELTALDFVSTYKKLWCTEVEDTYRKFLRTQTVVTVLEVQWTCEEKATHVCCFIHEQYYQMHIAFGRRDDRIGNHKNSSESTAWRTKIV